MWSSAQRETVEGISPKGFVLIDGQPCECGDDHYRTSKKRGYSDSMTYIHTCSNCDNVFKTFIEG